MSVRKPILLLLITIVAIPLRAQNSEQTGSDYKFISFNIRLGSEWARQYDGPNHWDHRREAVVRMILDERPDAIGMQEVLPNQLHYLDSALAGYQRIGVGREDGREQGECMAVYYRTDRFTLDRSATRWLSPTPDQVGKGWDAACHRTVTLVLLRDRHTRQPLLYMNTHLDHVGQVARAESVKLLARLADEWGRGGVPLILGGDMNSAADDTIFNCLAPLGFERARQAAPLTDNEATYTGFGKDTPSQIDHFFDRGIRVKEFRTLKGDYGVPYISDHYPVAIRFALP